MDELSSAEDALSALTTVVHRIRADDLDGPTPCTDYNVATLAEHLIGTIIGFAADAGAEVSVPPDLSLERRIVDATQGLLSVWRRRGLEGEAVLAGRTLPANLALGVASLELAVHGWDLAVATGQRITISDTHAEFILGLSHHTLTAQSRISAGFDNPVPIPDDSPGLDRLVAFTGRDPGWAPAATSPDSTTRLVP